MSLVLRLIVQFGDPGDVDSRQLIGKVSIDSAKIVVADKADIENWWTKVGPDRIGVISTPDDKVLPLLTTKFSLATTKVNPIRFEVIHPVSETLEAEIIAYLKTVPRYAQYPGTYFNVQTNNSFDRVNFLDETWSFMSVGNAGSPMMFACVTGYGDGIYNAYGEFSRGILHKIIIRFANVE